MTRKRKKTKLFQLKLTGSSETFPEQMKQQDRQLSTEILSQICQAIDDGLDEIEIFEMVTPVDIMVMVASKDDYLRTLQINSEKMATFEEYEVCQTVKPYIDRLIEEENNKKDLDCIK